MAKDKTIYCTRPAILKEQRVEKGSKHTLDEEEANQLLASGRFSTEPPKQKQKDTGKKGKAPKGESESDPEEAPTE